VYLHLMSSAASHTCTADVHALRMWSELQERFDAGQAMLAPPSCRLSAHLKARHKVQAAGQACLQRCQDGGKESRV